MVVLLSVIDYRRKNKNGGQKIKMITLGVFEHRCATKRNDEGNRLAPITVINHKDEIEKKHT